MQCIFKTSAENIKDLAPPVHNPIITQSYEKNTKSRLQDAVLRKYFSI
jgi:hypothetical protein